MSLPDETVLHVRSDLTNGVTNGHASTNVAEPAPSSKRSPSPNLPSISAPSDSPSAATVQLFDLVSPSTAATSHDEPEMTMPVVLKDKSKTSLLAAELFPEYVENVSTPNDSVPSSRSSSSRPEESSVKLEQEDAFAPRRSKREASTRKSTGGATSPSVLRNSMKAKKEEDEDVKPKGRQYIFDLPDAEEKAMSEFEELDANWYQNKGIGAAKQQEDSFQCECQFNPAEHPPHYACGDESGCINRLTQVECPKDDCRCRKYCQNQRMQKRQYAPLKIVQTEKKGYGVMANEDLRADTLVYEYIGEVIGHNNFVKRMANYADEGIRHFYFMALQKDEFIDATKKGGKGRFLNHSCNPNCYVAKWVVGKKLRMGIFTKRKVEYGEELTFNYNVDRYGHEAQECYCGEPTCIGFIGGKTQTDLGFMDDLYLDALGITEEVEALGLKGNKRKKGKKLDDDFMPVMRPILAEEAPKVISAVRQAASTKRILTKLLTRMLITPDPLVQSQLMRLRGFSLMAMLLEEHDDDQLGVVQPVLEVMQKWPLLSRNKISSTNVEPIVTRLVETSTEDRVKDLAKELLHSWSELELAYRIPKALRDAAESGKRALEEESVFSVKRQRTDEPEAVGTIREAAAPTMLAVKTTTILYEGWQSAINHQGRKYYYHVGSRTTRWNPPSKEEAQSIHAAYLAKSQKPGVDLNDIIAKAQAQADALALANAPVVVKPPTVSTKIKKEKKEKKVIPKDRRILKLFSPVVVKAMSRYAQGALGKSDFKRRAQELTTLLVEKEAKSSNFEKEEYLKLSPEKEAKIRQFVKDWVAKLLARKGVSAKSHRSSSSSSSRKDKDKERSHHRSHSSSKSETPSTSATTLDTPSTSNNDTDDKKAQEEQAAADMLAELEAEDKADQEEDEEEEEETIDEEALQDNKAAESAALLSVLQPPSPPPPPPEDEDEPMADPSEQPNGLTSHVDEAQLHAIVDPVLGKSGEDVVMSDVQNKVNGAS